MNSHRSLFEPLESRHLLSATVIEVTTTQDLVDPNDAFISLREAVLMANASPEDNEIILAAGTYTLTRQGANENAALTGDLDVVANGSLKITGAGRDQTTIDAAGLFHAGLGYGDRICEVFAGASVEISAVTLTGGDLAVEVIFPNDGGAVRNVGNLTITDSSLTDNSALNGGAISNLTNAELFVAGSSLSQNRAVSRGGAIANAWLGVIDIDSSELIANEAVS